MYIYLCLFSNSLVEDNLNHSEVADSSAPVSSIAALAVDTLCSLFNIDKQELLLLMASSTPSVQQANNDVSPLSVRGLIDGVIVAEEMYHEVTAPTSGDKSEDLKLSMLRSDLLSDLIDRCFDA